MHIARLLAALIITQAATASAAATTATYYGPKSGGQGYKDQPTKDGYWKIETSTKGRKMLAIDVAIYRAAEKARDLGSKYVEIHDAYSAENGLGDQLAKLFARPASAPVNPTNCRSSKPNRCYTASVDVIMKRLSGASGDEPGMAAPSYVDQYGRTVTESGYGIGAVTPLMPVR